MPSQRYTTERIIGGLRETEVLLGQGQTVVRSAGAWELVTLPTTGGGRSMAAFGQT